VNDRAFRLDFFIAIFALLVSALTAGTLIYQTRVIGDQFSATIWPYLNVGTTYDSFAGMIDGETIEVTNDGLGPALIQSAQLRVDGTAVGAWNDYIRVLVSDPALRRILLRVRRTKLSMSSLGPSDTLRPGESYPLLKISSAQSIPARELMRHSVSIELCYCSLNGRCWTLRATPGQIAPNPQPVPRCTTNFAIESRTVTNPVPPAR